jgi:hypothetical protein
MATAAAVTESRGDLLNWLNDLLQLSLTKIESVGTGAVHCQIMDSIFGTIRSDTYCGVAALNIVAFIFCPLR